MLQNLKTIDGEADILESDDEGALPVTLRKVCTSALLTTGRQELTEKEKVNQFFLAQKVALTREVELTPEDVVLLKRSVGKLYPPLVVGRVFEILDPTFASGNGDGG